MEHLLQDKPVITFDISDILNKTVSEMEQIDPNDLPDEVLKDLLDSNDDIFPTEASEVEPNKVDKAEDRSTPLQLNCFQNDTKIDVAQIASKSCKKTTHKQTAWGVKVFRGRYQLLLYESFVQK